MRREKVCPVCGNEIVINTSSDKMKCRFCKQWIQIDKTKKGKRVIVSLSEIYP